MRPAPILVFFLLLAAFAACTRSGGAGGEGPAPSVGGSGDGDARTERDFELVLAGAVDGRDLHVHLAWRDGRAAAAFASGYNAVPHRIDASGLRGEDGRIRGPLVVEVRPDPWLPKDGAPIRGAFHVDVPAPGGEGRWRGRLGGERLEGAAAMRSRPAEGLDGRYRIRIHQAFFALTREAGVKGPNQKYALDMHLDLLLRDGAVVWATLESVVPDYRGYSAEVRTCTAEVDGPRLHLRCEAELDTGEQGSDEVPRRADYAFEFDCLAIGDRVGGDCAIATGELRGQRPCWGEVDRAPPPPPLGARAWLRLHSAMREDWPVCLDLALDAERVHGFAWTPRYNHQPQPIDATGLRLEDGRLRGPVTVHVRPDPYHDRDVRFDLDFELDVGLADGLARGNFHGRDGEIATEGRVVGRLEERSPPAPADGLWRLDLRSAFRGGGKARVPRPLLEMRVVDSRVIAAALRDPEGGDRVSAEVAAVDGRLEGSRFAAEIAFALDRPAALAGDYKFKVEGIVAGERLRGLWFGFRDGDEILVKSAKLSGRRLAADRADTENSQGGDR